MRPDRHRLPVLLVCLFTVLLAAATANAGLPRTYTVTRVDSPNPTAGGDFGIGFVNTGDLNGDGKQDLLVGTDEHGGGPGQVFVISGVTGASIRTISSPEGCVTAADAGCGAGTGTPSSFGSYVGKIADIGSCSGGSPGATCAAFGAPDGIPDELVTALGVDVGFDCSPSPGDEGTLVDAGLAYVVDGATGGILKRLSMPDCDLYEESTMPVVPLPKPAFGRTILNPASEFGPTAADQSGPTTPPLAVRIGDLNGGGRPDVVVGASDYFETDTTANPASDCALSSPPNQCLQAGRAYVFYGETFAGAGSDPAVIDRSPDVTIKNPWAQADDLTTPVNFNRESMSYSIEPIGDIGKCNVSPGAGTVCTNANSTGTPDGKPDVVISSHRTDEFGMFDVGVAMLIDGATNSVLYTYHHPEPQPASIFAFSNYNQPAPGDLGSSTAPDSFQAAMRQDNPYTGGGRAWAMNGAFKQSGSPNSIAFATFNDPTPHPSEDFGTSSAGIGNVVGLADGLDGRTEMLIGAYGPHNPGTNQSVINDVHIFSALNELELQRLEAPDQQAGLGFGTALAPLGDLNGDGFLDYAVGAGLWDGPAGADQGRIYIFKSDNSPPPPPPPPPPAPPPPPPSVVLAGRTITLAANKHVVRRRTRVRLSGVLEAFANEAVCEGGIRVSVQSRSVTSPRYRTVARPKSSASGSFSALVRPSRTRVYRARVAQTAQCLGAVSERETVVVRPPKRKKRR